MRGDLTDAQARYWLEQDYLYLLDETRSLSRLASQAPWSDRVALIDLAWGVIHEELPKHRAMAARFGCDLDAARKSAVSAAYTAWLFERAADYGTGMVALLSGLWGYSTLGQQMQLPEEPRFRDWVASYQDPAFPVMARQYAGMVDALRIDEAVAIETFKEGLEHALAFWQVPA